MFTATTHRTGEAYAGRRDPRLWLDLPDHRVAVGYVDRSRRSQGLKSIFTAPSVFFWNISYAALASCSGK
jgi:hypothetical protein